MRKIKKQGNNRALPREEAVRSQELDSGANAAEDGGNE